MRLSGFALDFCWLAHQAEPAATRRSDDSLVAFSLNGSAMRTPDTTLIVGRDGNTDTEVMTTITECGDIVVAFRGSKPASSMPRAR